MGGKRWRIPVGETTLFADERGIGEPALVFLHYWGGSRQTWTAVIDGLADYHRCVAVDLRGWGESSHATAGYGLFAQADDVKKVIAYVGINEYVLVGHSMGGKIAQILAGGRPKGLRGVVLVAPAPPTPLQVPDEQKQQMLESYRSHEGVNRALAVLTNRPLTDEQRDRVLKDTLGGAEGAKLAWVEDGMALDISELAAAIEAPVSVFVGAADQVERESTLREAILPLIPHARFEILEDVGHLSPLEAPGSLAEAISDFLAH